MAKDAATGDVVIKHHNPPKSIKMQREGQGWPGHAIDHHTDRYRLSPRIGKHQGF